jgi:hypothetical protein
MVMWSKVRMTDRVDQYKSWTGRGCLDG